MKPIFARAALALLLVMCASLNINQSNAAGPAAAQQTVSQAQSALSEATLGWHRWGWGYGGWGYGGGWRHGGWGYGGWGYPGYYGWGGYPYYGVYSSPVIYSVPTYTYAPTYYTPAYSYVRVRPRCCLFGCRYAVAYQPTCCVNSYVAPSSSCCVSSYAYPTQSLVYSSSNVTPASYSSPAPASSYGSSGTYVPSDTSIYSPSTSSYNRSTGANVISTQRTLPARSNSTVAAPFPAPPVEYAKPVQVRGPIASVPATDNSTETVVPTRVKVTRVSQQRPANPGSANSMLLTQAEVTHTAYAPAGFYNYSSVAPLANRVNNGLVR